MSGFSALILNALQFPIGRVSFPDVETLVSCGEKLQFLLMGTLVSYNRNCRFFSWERSFPYMETELTPHMANAPPQTTAENKRLESK